MDPDYLRYKHRRPGYDHGLFDHSDTFRRPPIVFPGGARVAIVLMPVLQRFPLNMNGAAFVPPGGLSGTYPDTWNYSHRDYGNRVGIFRILDLLQELGLPATAAINAALVNLKPLVEQIRSLGWEVIGHGRDMAALHAGGLEPEAERRLVEEALGDLRRAFGTAIRGWLSPAGSQTFRTPDILAAHGIRYLFDWSNDDVPYRFGAISRELVALPGCHEISDEFVIHALRATSVQWYEQVTRYVDVLREDAARYGGRIVTLQIHPWIIGQPHRIGALRAALDRLRQNDDVVFETAERVVGWIAGQLPRPESG